MSLTIKALTPVIKYYPECLKVAQTHVRKIQEYDENSNSLRKIVLKMHFKPPATPPSETNAVIII